MSKVELFLIKSRKQFYEGYKKYQTKKYQQLFHYYHNI